FVPVPGYLEGLGISEDNEYDAREYPADFHMGVTRALSGADSGQTTRIEITAPERFTMNSVGVMTGSVVAGGKRTVVWESDYPVSSFNVVGGLWEVRRGDGTAIFYHPQHGYNIDEMIEALDGARRLYSEWFFPFPWAELKLSEFPAQASYAQGHSTNITFSEDMGFLVKSDRRMNVAFMVTAHEAAHQWWGGLVLPGKGPGGNILSEGMAHFSTILLFDALRGAGPRIEFCRRIEDKYCVQRSVDSERALVLIDGTRDGDHTVTYDKGAWVFWMVLDLIGRDHALDGIRSFVAHYAGNRDHPVLQDFVEHLRPFAPEPQAYDEFIDQWFFDVVLPEYVLQRQSRKQLAGGGWEVQFVIRNGGTGRMSVEVAAERGVRFPAAGAQQQAEPFEDQRTRVVLGRGESMEVSLGCSFEPQRIVIDPDARVLQRGRKFAIHRF
ncbi:MAG: M1 family metallopeptidase, partial [bacterium]|nr:M1 family metallopeptidase [bacterium]